MRLQGIRDILHMEFSTINLWKYMMLANYSDPQLQHISALISQQKYPEAKSLLAKYLRENPQSADACYLAAFVTNDLERKIQACKRALQLNPFHVQANELLKSLVPDQTPPAN